MDRDPEIVDDRDIRDVEVEPVELPDYDPTPFEISDDYEYVPLEDDAE